MCFFCNNSCHGTAVRRKLRERPHLLGGPEAGRTETAPEKASPLAPLSIPEVDEGSFSWCLALREAWRGLSS